MIEEAIPDTKRAKDFGISMKEQKQVILWQSFGEQTEGIGDRGKIEKLDDPELFFRLACFSNTFTFLPFTLWHNVFNNNSSFNCF